METSKILEAIQYRIDQLERTLLCPVSIELKWEFLARQDELRTLKLYIEENIK